jgi:hypothetical protein
MVATEVMSKDDDEAAGSSDPAVQKLIAAQRESGMSWSAIGEKLGYKHGYQEVMKIRKGTKDFRPELKKRIAEILGLPPDEFDMRPATQEQERIAAAVFDEFLATDVGRDIQRRKPDVIASLRRLPFVGDLRPSVPLFQMLALTMSGQATVSADDLARVVDENVQVRNAAEIVAEQATNAASKHPPRDSTSVNRRRR